MKKSLILLSLFGSLTCLLAACEKTESVNLREQQQAQLDSLLDEIEKISESVACEEAQSWKFTAIGAKACGGPVKYIAYSTQIETDAFLEKVKRYTELQDQFNKDWGVASDCSVPPTPIGVICDENQQPKLIYEEPQFSQ